MRVAYVHFEVWLFLAFPFLFGGTFIEGDDIGLVMVFCLVFPFLFGGTFIEGNRGIYNGTSSLRISLPFRRDFH